MPKPTPVPPTEQPAAATARCCNHNRNQGRDCPYRKRITKARVSA